MKKALIWLRNDLRVHDHEPLHQAIVQGYQVVGVFCIEPIWFKQHPLGFTNMGPQRQHFLRETLQHLQHTWKQLGAELFISYGSPTNVVPELCHQLHIDAVFYHHEVGVYEQQDEGSIKFKLPDSIRMNGYYGNTLHHPNELPFAISNLPELFTQYRKIVEQKAEVGISIPSPKKIPGFEIHLPDDKFWSTWETTSHKLSTNQVRGGEEAALNRLKQYVWDTNAIATYKQTRNELLGDDFSSKFSPWLAVGAISPRRIYEEVKIYERNVVANESTYWLIFELLWRDYFKWIAMKHGNLLFQSSGIQHLPVQWNENREFFERWQNGTTGIDFVDANMIELKETGFMSNRGRQNVASFLTKNLGINWLWGAAWFEHALIDYDVSSNYGNWMYVAGVGNDGRDFRYFNINKQANDYDADARFRTYWLAQRKQLTPMVDLEHAVTEVKKKFEQAWKQKKAR